MSSSHPYLLRALREWILDNAMTPHLLIDTTMAGVEVPDQFIENDRIILNIHPDAVYEYHVSNEAVSFNARFNARPCRVYVPMDAVLAVYARENSKGMIFPEVPPDRKTKTEKAESKDNNSATPHLRVIK